MARLCIRVAPNNHPTDPELDALRTHPGDVVCVVVDGHKFTDAEMNNGHYRIIDMPGVAVESVMHLSEQVHGSEGELIKRRKHTLDVSALNGGAWRTRHAASKEQIDAITLAKR